MRMLTAAAGAAVLILAATPALAGGPRGGGHNPRPPAPCCHGGGNTNVNVNVNAQARASASASAGSYFNARAYDVGGIRDRGYGGGVIYAGGGYGGDGGGYLGGPVYYNDLALAGPACPSAPFGYIVTGFGRDDHRPSWCGYRYDDHDRDRGGRYGYSERRESYGESRYESYESYEEYEAAAYYEARERRHDDGRDYRYDYDRRDCDCRGDREPAPYPPPYLPEPPRYEPPRYDPPPAPRERPYREPPPRQYYSQEPGERG